MPNENTDSRAILYAVREIQNDLSLQTAKPLKLFSCIWFTHFSYFLGCPFCAVTSAIILEDTDQRGIVGIM